MVLFSIKSRKSQPRSHYKMLAVQVPIKLKLLFKGLCPQRLFLIVPNEEWASAAAGGRPEKRRFYERFESKISHFSETFSWIIFSFYSFPVDHVIHTHPVALTSWCQITLLCFYNHPIQWAKAVPTLRISDWLNRSSFTCLSGWWLVDHKLYFLHSCVYVCLWAAGGLGGV